MPNGEVKLPTLVKFVDSDVSVIAREAAISGICKVYLLIDELGMPKDVAIQNPIGLGLDEKAIASVQQYRFSPATHNGKPVTVSLMVDVHFQFR